MCRQLLLRSKDTAIFFQVFSSVMVISSCAFISKTTFADHKASLQIIASSPSHTEILLIDQTGDDLTWRLYFPKGLESRNRKAVAQGTVRAVKSSMKKLFDSLVASQSSATQRSRVKAKDQHTPTFTLFYRDEAVQRIAWPLTPEELKEFVKSESMLAVFEDINSKSALLKPHAMLDFFSPERRNSIVNRNFVVEGEK